MPPWRAMATAMRPSVTLSIAADTSGTASSMSAAKRARRVDRVRQRLGVAGHDDDVVERQRLEAVEELVVDVGAVGTSCVDLRFDRAGAIVSDRPIARCDDRGVVADVVSTCDEQACSAACIVVSNASSDPPVSMATVRGGEYRSVVDAVVGDEVDHHAGARAFAGERLVPGPLDGVGAGQLAGQRRVQVDHLARGTSRGSSS